MIIDNFTIILSCAIIVVALLTSVLTNPFFRKFCEREMGNTDVADNDGNEKETAGDKPKVSVVIISNGTAEQMDQHLPVLLTQDYAPGYEVVVVAVKGDSATEDVLKRYASNPHLYTTFVPGRSLFMSRAKLALTIGVKAAHNEWVLVADSRHVPQSDEWIKTMATHCDDSTDMIMGYTGYDDTTTSYRRFERLREQTYFLRRAFRNEALCTKGANLMFRKRAFNYRNVFDKETNLMRGRLKNGEFQKPFSPLKWGDAFTEGNAWHYTWSVFHDPQGLIDLMGGKHVFNQMLDSVFNVPPLFDDSYYGAVIHEIREMQIMNMGNYAHGNQPVQHMIYLYGYSGEPWKT